MLTDSQFEEFLEFTKKVVVPGEVTWGTEPFARYIYARHKDVQYRITIEPYWDEMADEPIMARRDDPEA